MICRSILAVLVIFNLLAVKAIAMDMVRPNPDIAPAEVIAIQLNGLQNNNDPEIDSGIRQTWAFAHPRNRAATGPFARFAKMLKGRNYGIMLNHISNNIEPKNTGDGWKQYDVLMEIQNGNVMHFVWTIEKVTEGLYKDCWMTVAVSTPRLTGQGS